MFEDIIAQYGTKFLVAALAVLLGLACLALVLWIVRRRPSSPFIRGGRNRQPRLSVLDAAAVDTRRRLILVRRDDVEHLLMIGGPTDIVIESRIVGATRADLPEQSQQAALSEVPATAIAPSADLAPVAVPVSAHPAAVRSPAAQSAVPLEPVVSAIEAERREVTTRSTPPSGVSAMGQVLYGDETRAVPTPAQSPPSQDGLSVARNVAAATPDRSPAVPQPSISERSAIDALDRARDRVLTSPVGTGSERIGGQRELPAPQDPSSAPPRVVTDNAALVSEFEKILEAEITASAPRAPNGFAHGRRTEPSTVESQGEQPASREETEAEMARLLGELSASRKS